MIRWGCRHPDPGGPPRVTPTGYRYCGPCFELIEGLTEKRQRKEEEEKEEEEEEILAPATPRRDEDVLFNVLNTESRAVRVDVFFELKHGNPLYLTLPMLQHMLNHFQSGAYEKTLNRRVKEEEDEYQLVLELVCAEFTKLAEAQARALELNIVSIPEPLKDGTVLWAQKLLNNEPMDQPKGYYYYYDDDDDEVLAPTQQQQQDEDN